MKENKSKWKLEESREMGTPVIWYSFVNEERKTLRIKDRPEVPAQLFSGRFESSFLGASDFENGLALVALGHTEDEPNAAGDRMIPRPKIEFWLLIDEDGHILCQFIGKDMPFKLGNNYVGLNQERNLIFHDISAKKTFVCDDKLIEDLTHCIKRVKKFQIEAEKEKQDNTTTL